MLNATHGPARRFVRAARRRRDVRWRNGACDPGHRPPGPRHAGGDRAQGRHPRRARRQGFHRSAAPGELERFGTHCDGDKVEITADGGGSNKKQAIKLFICGDKGQGAAGLADALSKAMANIDKDNRELDPKLRDELRAKIDAKIRELRTKG